MAQFHEDRWSGVARSLDGRRRVGQAEEAKIVFYLSSLSQTNFIRESYAKMEIEKDNRKQTLFVATHKATKHALLSI